MKRFNPPPYAIIIGHVLLAVVIYFQRDPLAAALVIAAYYLWVLSIVALLARGVVKSGLWGRLLDYIGAWR